MIHVKSKPEPKWFDKKVRQQGRRWMQTKGIVPGKQLKSGTKLPDYWRCCLDEMYTSYAGCCAYLGVKLSRVQTITIDHYQPKSKHPELAYEWSNYRLCTPQINSNKGDKDGVLDPFTIQTGWFCYNFIDGSVYANNSLPDKIKEQVEHTIEFLKLNDSHFCDHRCSRWDDYKNQPGKLQEKAPFIYSEAIRQNKISN